MAAFLLNYEDCHKNRFECSKAILCDQKVKMNPNVFQFARRPCALVLVSLSHVNDNEE